MYIPTVMSALEIPTRIYRLWLLPSLVLLFFFSLSLSFSENHTEMYYGKKKRNTKGEAKTCSRALTLVQSSGSRIFDV